MAIIALDGRTNLTWAELISIVSTRLGKRTNLDDEIENELILAQMELEQRALLPDWLIKHQSDFTFTAGTEDQATGAQFTLATTRMRATYEDGSLYIEDNEADTNEQFSPLQRVSQDDLFQEAMENPASGIPKYYSMRTTYDQVKIKLFPGISAADISSGRFILHWRGKQAQAFGDAAIDGNEATVADSKAWITRASALLIEMACYRVALTISHPKLVEFKSERDRLLIELEKLVTAEEVRDMELFMGGG